LSAERLKAISGRGSLTALHATPLSVRGARRPEEHQTHAPFGADADVSAAPSKIEFLFNSP
jgi:hypothetical protein